MEIIKATCSFNSIHGFGEFMIIIMVINDNSLTNPSVMKAKPLSKSTTGSLGKNKI